MAMQYVPDDKKEEIRRKICEDCKYNNGEEQLACCYCQECSLFEEKEKKYLVAIEGKHPSLSRMNQIVVQNLDGIAIEIVNLVFVEIVKIGLNVMVAIQ